jgi:hypothetical protein
VLKLPRVEKYLGRAVEIALLIGDNLFCLLVGMEGRVFSLWSPAIWPRAVIWPFTSNRGPSRRCVHVSGSAILGRHRHYGPRVFRFPRDMDLANFTILEDIVPLESAVRIDTSVLCLGGRSQACGGQLQAKGGQVEMSLNYCLDT